MNLIIQMEGIPDIQHEFQEIVSEQKIRRLLEQVAILVEGEAKRRCPVRTGRLMHSITHHALDVYTQEIVATANYADYVEYGTIRMHAGTPEQPYVYTGPVSGKYPSYRPFLRSALYSNINRIIDYIESQLLEKESP